jgi:hypothetical protein
MGEISRAMAEMRGPRTKAEWDAYHALPQWEVTARMSRMARFRVHAPTAAEAAAAVTEGRNGVGSLDDLYDPGDLEIDEITGTRQV